MQKSPGRRTAPGCTLRVYWGRLQHLGIYTQERISEPYVVNNEDIYQLCRDGPTDMQTNLTIGDIMFKSSNVESCARQLKESALEHRGHDKVTIIVGNII